MAAWKLEVSVGVQVRGVLVNDRALIVLTSTNFAKQKVE